MFLIQVLCFDKNKQKNHLFLEGFPNWLTSATMSEKASLFSANQVKKEAGGRNLFLLLISFSPPHLATRSWLSFQCTGVLSEFALAKQG